MSASFGNRAEPGIGEGDRVEILITLVEAYETRHSPVQSPDPIEAIRFRMERGGLTVKDLVPSIGQPNRVYEVLNSKRGLTIDMIRNLGLPAESLSGAYRQQSHAPVTRGTRTRRHPAGPAGQQPTPHNDRRPRRSANGA